MKRNLTTLWMLLLMIIVGSGNAWADTETYSQSVDDNGELKTTIGSVALDVSSSSQTIQATNSVQVTYGKGGWVTDPSKNRVQGNLKPQNSGGEYSYNNYTLPNQGSYLVITPSRSGTITFNGTKLSGGNKYMVIQTSNASFVSTATVTCGSPCEWNETHRGYNMPSVSSATAFTAEFSVDANTTYYILFEGFKDWAFNGFTFTSQKTDISDAEFRFTHSLRNTHYGETYEGNPLINTKGVPVTYSSSNTGVATVDPSTGAVTIQNVSWVSSTIITATFAGDENYNGRKATYSLNVAPALVYTDIPVSALRYRPGVNGISASGMTREVGGFRLTFWGGEGIKCNNTNNFYFRTNGSGENGVMTIAMDDNNSGEYLKKIVFTAWGTPSLAVGSVAKTSGTLTQTGPSEWTWTNFYDNVGTVTFTSQGANDESILISNIRVYTNNTPKTLGKTTPTLTITPRTSDSFYTGDAVNISDLDISTTPDNFLFDYTFNAGTTGLTHTPYINNTTWPGTITGTAANGTAAINASFGGNPFYNNVPGEDCYTITVTTPAKYTFTWDFTQALSEVDTKLLNATTDTWVLEGNYWKLTGGSALSGAFTQNGKELEYVYGLQAYNPGGPDGGSNTLIYTNGGGFRLNSGNSRYLRIPNLKAGDKVTIVCHNYKSGRGINHPVNISEEGAENWGDQASTDFTCVGYVKADGNVDLYSTSAMDVRTITVESANKPWPALSFTNGSKVNVAIPYGSSYTTYTNALSSVPAGATANYSILLDANAGSASAASINSSTGELTIKGEGEIIVRVTTTAGTNNSAYYCDYILNATQADEYASWAYSADEMEIDGENRPYQGTVTFISSGKIDDSNRTISDVPGITLTVGVSGTDYTVDNNGDVGLAASSVTYTFTPIVNGYLKVNMRSNNDHTYIRKDGDAFLDVFNVNGNYTTPDGNPLIAGHTYTLHVKTDGSYNNIFLHSFTFRPAFLNPGETAEQTATFEAYSNTTEFPKLVHDASAGVRFAGNRSVVNLSSDGGVELVGGGTAVVRGKIISGEHELVAHYTLHANVLSVVSTTPTSGSTITSLTNNAFYIEFNEAITIADASKVVVLKDAATLTGLTVEIAESSITNYTKVLKISGFPTPLEAGSTYTIRLKEKCVYKTGEVAVANPEEIFTFTIESNEPPLTWVYPTTTSAVRIGTSIVLQTSENVDENYPISGIYGTLTYEGGGSDADYPMTMKAILDGKRIVFKPTKPMVPNKLYTLTVGANQVKLDNKTDMITKDKIFLFTTGTGTGAVPTLQSSTPAEGATSMPYAGGTIEFIFDVNVELEPYSTVTVTPVNGSESTAKGMSDKLDNSGVLVPVSLYVDGENNRRVYFTYSQDALKYDLYYKMVFPANTVTGPGGMPNTADIVVNFRMQRNPASHEVTPATFYPHTWDFNRFGDKTLAGTTAFNIVNGNGNPGSGYQVNSLEETTESGYKTYKTKAQDGYGFDQGADVYFHYKLSSGSAQKEVMDEFEGIRISLVKSASNRFEIRNETSASESNKNTDGTDKWVFRMNGNTHYMTLSNVPVGMVYMVVNAPHLGINSPNASFASVSGEDYVLSNENTLLNTNGTKKVAINVTEAGDLVFCVMNLSLEKIGVAAFEKPFNANYVVEDGKTYKTYTSDSQACDIRYDLSGAFTNDEITAYYISSIADNSSDNTATATALAVRDVVSEGKYNDLIKSGQGTILVCNGDAGGRTVPLFKNDVNTVVHQESPTNKLVGTPTEEAVSCKDDEYVYVLSYGGTGAGGTEYGVGFYRYTGAKSAANKAYLRVPKAWVDPQSGSGAKSIRLVFDDNEIVDGVETVSTNGKSQTDGYYYNLNGMRVENPGRGVYIRNGKKVVIK